MRRLFVALAMPDAVRARLSEMLCGIPGARWVNPENLHLTLRFIGEVDGGAAEEIADSLSRLQAPAFDLTLEGLGHFESRGRLRALWVGVRPEPALTALQRKVENAVVAAGLPPESRKFKPHVTLARFSGTPLIEAGRYVEANAAIRLAPFPVTEVVLFESRLGRGGPAYFPELEISLDPAPAVVAGGTRASPVAER